jgi:nitrogen fixation/metabolism regulation signal transduction histidine kinase
MKRIVVERLTLHVSGMSRAEARRAAADVARRVAHDVRNVETSQPRLRLNISRKVR